MQYFLVGIFLMLLSLSVFAEPESECYGDTTNGRLENGWKLPNSGENYQAYSSLGVIAGRTYVHSKVYRTVLGAYEILRKTNPGVHYVYGETGFEEGGVFKPHKTHRNGLSVDFFVPVINAEDKPEILDIGITNKLGYNIEFSGDGKLNGLRIDFESIAKHIDALMAAAQKESIGIELVILDNQFQKLLFATPTGAKIRSVVTFSVKKPWVRHDEHYHINFRVPCKKL